MAEIKVGRPASHKTGDSRVAASNHRRTVRGARAVTSEGLVVADHRPGAVLRRGMDPECDYWRYRSGARSCPRSGVGRRGRDRRRVARFDSRGDCELVIAVDCGAAARSPGERGHRDRGEVAALREWPPGRGTELDNDRSHQARRRPRWGRSWRCRGTRPGSTAPRRTDARLQCGADPSGAAPRDQHATDSLRSQPRRDRPAPAVDAPAGSSAAKPLKKWMIGAGAPPNRRGSPTQRIGTSALPAPTGIRCRRDARAARRQHPNASPRN